MPHDTRVWEVGTPSQRHNQPFSSFVAEKESPSPCCRRIFNHRRARRRSNCGDRTDDQGPEESRSLSATSLGLSSLLSARRGKAAPEKDEETAGACVGGVAADQKSIFVHKPRAKPVDTSCVFEIKIQTLVGEAEFFPDFFPPALAFRFFHRFFGSKKNPSITPSASLSLFVTSPAHE